MVRLAIASAGAITGGAAFGERADVLAHQRAPVGLRRLHAQPEEAQAASSSTT